MYDEYLGLYSECTSGLKSADQLIQAFKVFDKDKAGQIKSADLRYGIQLHIVFTDSHKCTQNGDDNESGLRDDTDDDSDFGGGDHGDVHGDGSDDAGDDNLGGDYDGNNNENDLTDDDNDDEEEDVA